MFDLDTGEMVKLEGMDPVRRSSERSDDYANPCAVMVWDGHWPATTDGWIALGFGAVEAEQLVEVTKPELPAGCDRYSVELIAGSWDVVPRPLYAQ